MAKYDLIRALMGMKHSPAGRKHLKKKKSKGIETETVYFKGMKRKSIDQRLKDAGLSKEDLRSIRGKG